MKRAWMCLAGLCLSIWMGDMPAPLALRMTFKGVPIISAIPMIGGLFGKTETITEKRELLVLITPHVVTPKLLGKLEEKAVQLEKQIQ